MEASRPLHRLGFDVAAISTFRCYGLSTGYDLLSLSPAQLVKELELLPEDARARVRRACSAIAPPPQTARSMLGARVGGGAFLLTGIEALDGALRGGVPSRSVTEIVGPAGAGKTQLVTMLAVMAARDAEGAFGSGVLFIDTEGSFSGRRALEMGQALFPDEFSGERLAPSLAALASCIHVFHVSNSQGLMSVLQQLEYLIIEHSVNLIVLDSVAALARKEFDSAGLVKRQQMLSKQAALLKRASEVFAVPAIVTNQVTSGEESLEMKAALGNTWAHRY